MRRRGGGLKDCDISIERIFNNHNYLEKRDIFTFRMCWSKHDFYMNKIKEVLEKKGVKQTWLAEQLGKSYNMVNSYVQNRQQPRLEVLNDIAKILDVDVVELIVSSKKK